MDISLACINRSFGLAICYVAALLLLPANTATPAEPLPEATIGMLRAFDLEEMELAVTALTLTSDGKRCIGSICRFKDQTKKEVENFLQIWNLENGSREGQLGRWPNFSNCVAVSPNGELVANTCFHEQQATIEVLKVPNGESVRKFERELGFGFSLAFLPDNSTIMCASNKGALEMLSVNSDEAIATLKDDLEGQVWAALSPDGSHALTWRAALPQEEPVDTDLRLWDLKQARVSTRLRGHTGNIRSAAISPDGRTAVSSAADGITIWWDLNTGDVKQRHQQAKAEGAVLEFAPDNARAIRLLERVEVLDLQTGKSWLSVHNHGGRSQFMALTADGTRACIGGNRGWWLCGLACLPTETTVDVAADEKLTVDMLSKRAEEAAVAATSQPPLSVPAAVSQTPEKQPARQAPDKLTSRKPRTVRKRKIAEKSGPIRAALVDRSHSSVGTLLEARLLEQAEIEWVDRNHIDRTLDEQNLQALFSAEGGPQRVKLGELLKADLLLLMHEEADSEEPGKKRLFLVASESRRGLRLLRSGAACDDPEQAVEKLAAIVSQAIEKYQEEIKDVCAVPPFVSQDLGHRFDHLKSAYATLIEQLLINRPGILLVEFEEAQSLARETVLQGDDDRIDRQLPLYLLGEYRNNGEGDDRRVTFELKLARGNRELGITKQRGIQPDKVPELLRKLTTRAVNKVVGSEAPIFDPEEEADLLAARAKEFLGLKQWEEGYRMVEAALMLRPDDMELLRDGLYCCERFLRKHWSTSERSADRAAAHLAYFRRGLNWLEEYVALGGSSPKEGPSTILEFLSCDLHVTRHTAQGVRPVIREVAAERREVVGRVVRMAAHAGWPDFAEGRLIYHLYGDRELAQRCAWIHGLIVDTISLPDPQRRTKCYAYMCSLSTTGGLMNRTETLDFLDKLDSLGHDGVRLAVQEMRADLAAASIAQPLPPPVEDDFDPAKTPEFKPIMLTTTDPAGLPSSPPYVEGVIQVGKGIDLFLINHSLYLMKERGVLIKAWRPPDGNAAFHISNICFDGRYVWAPAQLHRQPMALFVVDPQSGETWNIGDTPSLPLQRRQPKSPTDESYIEYLRVAPIGPGKACVAGYFGETWLAVVEFEPQKGAKAQVFHEARRAAVTEDPNGWKRPDISFKPPYMFTVPVNPKFRTAKNTRVLIGREGTSHPLSVNAHDLSVEVVADELGGAWSTFESPRWFPAEDSIVCHAFDGVGPGFATYPAPEFKRSKLEGNAPDGLIATRGEQVVVCGDGCWIKDGKDTEFRKFVNAVPFVPAHLYFTPNKKRYAEGSPSMQGIWPSEHYGFVVARRDGKGQMEYFALEPPGFQEPKRNPPEE